MPTLLETDQTSQPEPRTDQRDLLTIDELMTLTGWGRTFLYEGAKANTLPVPTLRSGRKYYFSRAAYERWLRGDHQD